MAGLWCGYQVPERQLPVQAAVEASFQRAEIASRAALLVDEDGRVCYSQAIYERLYPASLTKLLTALVVREALPDVEQSITVQPGALRRLAMTHASAAGLKEGETLSVRALLEGLLLPSGADAAWVLAEAACGSEEEFIRRMNDKALALGMVESQFANATGLNDERQYSTASDLMRLWEAVLADDLLRQIVTEDYSADGRFASTLASYGQALDWNGGRILGGKTGFTSQTGQCLASVAEANAAGYRLITLGASSTDNLEPRHLDDARLLYAQFTR